MSHKLAYRTHELLLIQTLSEDVSSSQAHAQSDLRSHGALRAGRIRGAGLDVFYNEPLPAESPLWKLDNVLMSAHTADRTKEFQFESMQLFCTLAREYVEAGELSDKNVVDKRQGY